jgi:uncharacterized lipoprotein YmbA
MKMLPLLLITASLLLSGCRSSQPTRYYVLAAAPAAQDAAAKLASPSLPSPVMLRRLRLPEYLDRAEIVRRQATNELSISDHDLWGEKFKLAMTSVLERNLAALLGDQSLLFFRNYAVPADCRYLLVNFHQFEAAADKEFIAAGYCYLETVDGVSASPNWHFSYSQPLAGDSISCLVDAHNSALADIARQIAAALSSAP